MSVFKCKMCGGDIEVSEDKTIGICDYCGTTVTFPKISDEQKLEAFNRGNYFRRLGEFDKAIQVYERIIQEEPRNAEAHWCCALCRFGIEYVEDPITMEYIPTCHRASFDIFTEDIDYLAAVDNADGITRRQYQKDASKIAEVQRGIIATSRNEEPFDVFICYKETDENGNRTVDSTYAQEIYYQLTDAGFRVFFSRITLENIAGNEYEPYIFAALNSAKAMICIVTSVDYINSVWVRNEWTRYLALMRHDRSKVMLPCYKDVNPYDMPEQLSVLQSYDMTKIGFLQDLIRGIKKIVTSDEPKIAVQEPVVNNVQQNVNIAPLIKRVFMFLEDGKWEDADIYCEKVLDQDPECAEAYLGKLMAELHVKKKDLLQYCSETFDNRDNFYKASRFSDEISRKLLNDNKIIRERNNAEKNSKLYRIADTDFINSKDILDYEKAKAEFEELGDYKDSELRAMDCRDKINELRYDEADQKMKFASTEGEFRLASEKFMKVKDYRDSFSKARKCNEKAENLRMESIYNTAVSDLERDTITSVEAAKKGFDSIIDYSDSKTKSERCSARIGELKIAEEKAAEERKKKAEKAKKIAVKTAIISAPVIAVIIAALVLVFRYFIPNKYYTDANDALEAKDYATACALFSKYPEFKDTEELLLKAKKSYADELLKNENYDAAYKLFEETGNEAAVEKSKYKRATEYAENGDDEKALELFGSILTYKDSEDKATELEKAILTANFSKVKVGDEINFGNYYQKSSEEKSPLKWIVISKRKGKLLLLTKNVVDFGHFDNNTSEPWSDSYIRDYLNDDFCSAAFASYEQSSIETATVSADEHYVYNTYSGRDTEDKVFLLSVKETEIYLNEETFFADGTEYADQQRKNANQVITSEAGGSEPLQTAPIMNAMLTVNHIISTVHQPPVLWESALQSGSMLTALQRQKMKEPITAMP